MASPERRHTENNQRETRRETTLPHDMYPIETISEMRNITRVLEHAPENNAETWVMQNMAQKEKKENTKERLRRVLEERKSKKAEADKDKESNEQVIFQGNEVAESKGDESKKRKKRKKKNKANPSNPDNTQNT
jgi:hypothetical protein